jgi:NAD(P)-dependent dehydrogenase (short-subunit alcohol dehydrogenase family)
MRPDSPVALVTGASRNLGKVIALTLLEDGARVMLAGTNREALQAVARESGASPEQVAIVAADLGLRDGVTDVVVASRLAFGHVDVVINNAAITPEHLWPDWDLSGEPQPWTLDADVYQRFLDINAIAPHIIASAFIPGMIERGWGRVVNVTTSLDSMLTLWPYGSSKAALEAGTAQLAQRLAGTGVTANALLPGGYVAAASRRSPEGEIVHQALPPSIMAAPIRWLVSAASDEVSGRRFLAVRWDTSQPLDKAAQAAGFPIAWTGFGPQAVNPPPAVRVTLRP